MRILLLDPNPVLTRLYLKMLEAPECCMVAHTVQDAESLVAKHGIPDVLVTEREVSGPRRIGWSCGGTYDGDAFASRLIAREPNLPVVYIVAISSEGLHPRQHQVVLLKPFWAQQLREAVADAIAGSTQPQTIQAR